MKKIIFIFLAMLLTAVQTVLAQKDTLNYMDANGKKQGHWIQKYPNGNVQFEGYFKNNNPVGQVKKYHENGKLKYDMYYNPKDLNQVTVTMYDIAGELAAKGEYYAKKKNGLWQYYGASNQVMLSENYNHGLLDGKSVVYWQTNPSQEMEIKFWKDSLKHGDWIWFYEDGKIRQKAQYKENKLNGDFLVFFPDGTKHIEGKYFEDVRDGVWNYFKEDGSLTRYEQTAMLYALYLDLLPNEESVAVVTDELISSIEKYGNCMYTGFLGTSIITKTLTKIGRSDVAYTLLLQHNYPSWLYSVDQGANTIWERWNTYTTADGFGDVSMNSFNHYSYGAVAGWMYQTIAGIGFDPENPGFKNIVLAPAFDTRLSHIKSSYESAYGLIQTETTVTEGGWTYTATVPANTTATAKLPAEGKVLTVNGKTIMLERGKEAHLTPAFARAYKHRVEMQAARLRRRRKLAEEEEKRAREAGNT